MLLLPCYVGGTFLPPKRGESYWVCVLFADGMGERLRGHCYADATR